MAGSRSPITHRQRQGETGMSGCKVADECFKMHAWQYGPVCLRCGMLKRDFVQLRARELAAQRRNRVL